MFESAIGGRARLLTVCLMNPIQTCTLRLRTELAVCGAGWLSPGDPDPAGRRLEVVRRALAENQHIEGLFWECARGHARTKASAQLLTSSICLCVAPHSYASLYQHPPGGRRTPEENEAFGRALSVMADVYASAVGTTVLQIKEIPPRPKEYDGALCLFGHS